MALTRITEGVIKPNENYVVNNINSSGVTTSTNFKTGTSNLHNVGIEIAGINVLGADTPIGTGATIYDAGGAVFTGVVTATSFSGSGNISADGNISGVDATFTGNVSIGGTLTYEDVTNVDAVGLVTARTGLVSPYADIDDWIDVGNNIQLGNAGVITATTFKGGTFFGTGADINGDLDVDGHTNLDNVSIAGVTTTAGNVNIAHGTGQAHYQITQTSGNTVKMGIVSGSDFEISGSSNNNIILKRAGATRLTITTDGATVAPNLTANSVLSSYGGIQTKLGFISGGAEGFVGTISNHSLFIKTNDANRIKIANNSAATSIGGAMAFNAMLTTQGDVSGGLLMLKAAENTNRLFVSGTDSNGVEVNLYDDAGGQKGILGVSGSEFFLKAPNNSAPFKLYTHNGSSVGERLQIDHEGLKLKNLDNGGGISINALNNTSNYGLIVANANRPNENDLILGVGGSWAGDSVAQIDFRTGADTTNKDDGKIMFYTQASNAGGLEERMRITSNGSVNIGSGQLDQTDRLLNVYGGRIRISGLPNNSNSLEIYASATTGQSHGIMCQAGTNASDINSTFRNTSGATLFRVRGDGNIGVGVDAPSRKVHIKQPGIIKLENTSTGGWLGLEFLGSSGTNNYDAYMGILDSNGLFFIDNNSNGNDICINRIGKVFIGPDATDFSDAGSFLNLRNNTFGGRIAFSNDTATAGVALMEQMAYWGSNKVAGMIISAGSDTSNKDDASMTFYTAPAGTLGERLRIASTGLIGINQGSSYNPLTSLDIRHHNGTAGTGTKQYIFTLCAGRNSARGLEIGTGHPTTGNQNDAGVYYNAKDTESSSYSAQHVWQLGGGNAMVLGYTGKYHLGIGENYPAYPLDIAYTDNSAWQNGAIGNAVEIHNKSTTAGTSAGIHMYATGNGANAAASHISCVHTANGTGDMSFATRHNAGSHVERMRLHSEGILKVYQGVDTQGNHGGSFYSPNSSGYVGTQWTEQGAAFVFYMGELVSGSSSNASSNYVNCYTSHHWGDYPRLIIWAHERYYRCSSTCWTFGCFGGSSPSYSLTQTESWGSSNGGHGTDNAGSISVNHRGPVTTYSGSNVHAYELTMSNTGNYSYVRWYIGVVKPGARGLYSSAQSTSTVDGTTSSGGCTHLKTMSQAQFGPITYLG